MWARRFDCCAQCGTTDFKHRSQGLCTRCYQRHIEKRHKESQRHRGIAAAILTRQYLIEEYCNKQRSLSEIARQCNCSRQYVYKKMRECNIPLRNKSEARNIALSQRKITAMRIDATGQHHSVVHRKIELEEDFFSSWSQEMAYVLGLIFTDGNLQTATSLDAIKGSYARAARISIAQKEPEILHKILALMNCNAKLYFSTRREYMNTTAGQLCHISIANNKLYNALTELGLKPRKSTDIKFPAIPEEHIRHFIRGCWDGDGTVYVEKRRQNYLQTSYVSASLVFIKGMMSSLEEAGLPKRQIHERPGKSRSYYFRYTGQQCTTLYHYFYDGVPPTQYLARKYRLFKKYCDITSDQIQLF